MSKGLQTFLQKHKKLFLVHLVSLGVLLLGFLICRYAVFGVIHGMKEWPLNLFLVGLIALLISLLAGKQYAPWFTSVGYSLGFWLGVLFHTEGYDPGGGKTDNLWIIWTIVFLACILAGFAVEVAGKWRRLLKKQ